MFAYSPLEIDAVSVYYNSVTAYCIGNRRPAIKRYGYTLCAHSGITVVQYCGLAAVYRNDIGSFRSSARIIYGRLSAHAVGADRCGIYINSSDTELCSRKCGAVIFVSGTVCPYLINSGIDALGYFFPIASVSPVESYIVIRTAD